jgi:hypothetical protein
MPFVPMMEPSDLRKLHDPSHAWRLNLSKKRSILAKRQAFILAVELTGALISDLERSAGGIEPFKRPHGCTIGCAVMLEV